MKLKHFITESSEAEVKKWFKVEGKLTETPDGIVVDGNLQIIGGKVLPELPFKIAEVTGEFSMENAKITSLKNFPDRADVIIVDGNPTLTSFAGGEGIVCDEFSAVGCGVVNLQGCPSAKSYKFRRSARLESTKGLNTSQQIESVLIDLCPMLTDIDELTKRIAGSRQGKSTITYNQEINLLKLILVNGNPGYLNFNIAFPDDTGMNPQEKNVLKNLQNLFSEFKGKGLSSTIEFIRRYYNEAGEVTRF